MIEALRTGATESAIPGTAQVLEADGIQAKVRAGKTLPAILSDLAPANGTICGASQTLRDRTTQILIDEVARTSGLRGFDRELALIPPASIDRIEVVKGSTARFGNGATSRIINMVNKKAGEEDGRTTLDTTLSFQTGNDSGLSYGTPTTHDRRIGDLSPRLELTALATDVGRRSAFSEPSAVNNLFCADGLGSTVQDRDAQSELFTTTQGLNVTLRSPADWAGRDATLTWGIDIGRDDMEQQRLDGTDIIAPMTQENLAAFAQLDMSLEVIGGDFAYDAVVGNLGAVLAASPTVDIYGGFSQGFSIRDVGAFTRRARTATPTVSGQTIP